MQFTGEVLEFEVLESTNKTAADLLTRGEAGHGSVILAHAQHDGRGQRGRSWQSEPGRDLTFSIVARPEALRADGQFMLSKVAALAVHDAVRAHVDADVRIKWPNDILVDRRKVAGILIKNDLVGDLVVTSVVGIGLNVNSTAFPNDLLATSLALERGQEFDRMEVLRQLLDRFNHWWAKWQAAPEEGLVSYTDRLWARGRWTDMLLDDRPVKGRAMDVDGLGRLIVEMEDGRVAPYGLDRLRFAPR